MDPNFGIDKMLDPRFFGPKSPCSSALPPTARDCMCCLQHVGLLMESRDHWSANLGRLWKMFGSSQTSADSARAPRVHVELRF